MDDFLMALDVLQLVQGIRELFSSQEPLFDKAEQYFKNAKKRLSKSDDDSIEDARYIKDQANIAIQLFDKCSKDKQYQVDTINYYKGLCYLYISAADRLINPREVKNDLAAAIKRFKKIVNDEINPFTINAKLVKSLQAEAQELLILANQARDSWIQAEGGNSGMDLEVVDFDNVIQKIFTVIFCIIFIIIIIWFIASL